MSVKDTNEKTNAECFPVDAIKELMREYLK